MSGSIIKQFIMRKAMGGNSLGRDKMWTKKCTLYLQLVPYESPKDKDSRLTKPFS